MITKRTRLFCVDQTGMKQVTIYIYDVVDDIDNVEWIKVGDMGFPRFACFYSLEYAERQSKRMLAKMIDERHKQGYGVASREYTYTVNFTHCPFI